MLAGCPGTAPSFTMLLEVIKAKDNSRGKEGHSELGQVQIQIRAFVLEAVSNGPAGRVRPTNAHLLSLSVGKNGQFISGHREGKSSPWIR